MIIILKRYDLIFIDAAKAQYRRYFERYEVLLSNNGAICCDNIFDFKFHKTFLLNHSII